MASVGPGAWLWLPLAAGLPAARGPGAVSACSGIPPSSRQTVSSHVTLLTNSGTWSQTLRRNQFYYRLIDTSKGIGIASTSNKDVLQGPATPLRHTLAWLLFNWLLFDQLEGTEKEEP